MANTRFFLDERSAKSGNPSVLKVAIAHKKRTALISLDAKIFPNQWDRKKLRVVNHPDQLLMNVYISTVKQQIDSFILSRKRWQARFHGCNSYEEPLYFETIEEAAKCVADIVGHTVEPNVEAIDQALDNYLAEHENDDTWYSFHEFIEERDS